MEFEKDEEGMVKDPLALFASVRRGWTKRSHEALMNKKMDEGMGPQEAEAWADERQITKLLERGENW